MVLALYAIGAKTESGGFWAGFGQEAYLRAATRSAGCTSCPVLFDQLFLV